MRIGRTLPPAATPIGLVAYLSGLAAMLRGRGALDRFADEIKSHFGVRHCYLVSSGKAALTVILQALEERTPQRKRVLIPAFTCFSVPSAVVRAGLEIYVCDQQADTFDFDYVSLEAGLGKGQNAATTVPLEGEPAIGGARFHPVLAVLPTHLYGYPADVSRIRKAIDDPDVVIVEDAAQAMGEASSEGLLGTLGDVSFFSLARGKAFSTVEGGVILTNRDDLAGFLARQINLLQPYDLMSQIKLVVVAAALMVLTHPLWFWLPKAMPFLRLGETLFDDRFPMRRMSSFQAGLTRNWRRRLELYRDTRKRNASSIERALDAFPALEAIPRRPADIAPVRLPLRIRDAGRRNALLYESERSGMGIMPAYPTSIDAIPELAGKITGSPCPAATACARELVTLPTHVYLTDADVLILAGMVGRAVS